MAEREKLIELKDLQITFGSGKKKFVAVDHVNFDIYKGETFSLVGESVRPPLAVPSAASTRPPAATSSSRARRSTARSPRNWTRRSSARSR